jgi:hypothetical protein
MSEPRSTDRLTLYLLGRLPEAEAEALEREYFKRPAALEDLLAAQDDLIDDYLQGGLSEMEARRLEDGVLATRDGRARLELARALTERAAAGTEPAPATVPAEVPPRRAASPRWTAALAAGLAVALAGAGFWVHWSLQAARELAAARAAREQAESRSRALSAEADAARQQEAAERRRATRLEEELAQERLRAPAGRVLSIVLAAGLERGPQGPRAFSVPPAAREVRLRLLLERDPHPSYGVSVETPEGRRLAVRNAVVSQSTGSGRAVDVVLPAGLLRPGTYVALLHRGTGAQETSLIDAYPFEVLPAP